MTEFENTLIQLAITYYKEAESWSNKDGAKQSIIDLANDNDMSVDELSRFNMSHAITKSLTLCELTDHDSDLSEEARQTLMDIAEKVGKLKHQDAAEIID